MRYVLLLSLVLGLAACYPQAAGTGNDEAAPSACPSTIEINNFAFGPAACTVEAGTTLTFVNLDAAPHTATARAGAPEAFDTGTLSQGQSATVTFETPGSYDYFCQIHPSMEALIVVVGAEGGAAEEAGALEVEDEPADEGDDNDGYGSGGY